MPAGGPISCDRRSEPWRTAGAAGPRAGAGARPRRPPRRAPIAARRPQLSCTRRSTRRSSGAPCSTRIHARTAAPAISRSRRETGSGVASDRGGYGDEHERVERQDREPAVPDAAEADDGRGEVAVHDPREPVARVVVLQQRLGARRDDHRAGRDERERADRRRRAPQRRREREAEERQQRDQEARPGRPAAER